MEICATAPPQRTAERVETDGLQQGRDYPRFSKIATASLLR